MKRVIVVFAALALAGCGEDDKVRATLDADRRALERGDREAGCALRTEAARREYCPTADENTLIGGEAIVTFESKAGPPPEIDVDGDRAAVDYGDGWITRLRKVDGRWLIDSAR